MSEFRWRARSLDDTDALGRALAAALPRGAVVALTGTLGAGKTRLVEAVAKAAGVDAADVTSPTFVLVNEYAAAVPIFHFDAYRIRDEDEFAELGADEYFAADGWSLVEWADRVAGSLPAEHIAIHIEPVAAHEREFAITGATPAMAAIVAAVARELTE